jgi:hypothetical protein
MRRAELPISALPAWAKLNDVVFYDISVQRLEAKGFGFVADRALSSEDTFDIPAMLSIPKDLILCHESVEEHARVDKDFRELLSAAGGKVGDQVCDVQGCKLKMIVNKVGYLAVSTYASDLHLPRHHSERRCLKSLDRICEVAAITCATSNYLDGGRASSTGRDIIRGRILELCPYILWCRLIFLINNVS